MKHKKRLFECCILPALLIALLTSTCYGHEIAYPTYSDDTSIIKITTSPMSCENLQKRVFPAHPTQNDEFEYLSLPEGTKFKITSVSKDVTYKVIASDYLVFQNGKWLSPTHINDVTALIKNGEFVNNYLGGNDYTKEDFTLNGDMEFSLPNPSTVWRYSCGDNEVVYDVSIYAEGPDNKVESYHFRCKIDSEIPVVGNFADVKKYHYFYEPVGWAVDNEITSGIDDEHFAPNMVTTRAQMVTFLWRAAGSPTVNNVKNDFEDVSKNSYYYDAVMWAVKNGITTGVTETEFKPDDAVTRAQAVTFLWRNAGNPEAAGETAFKDVVSGSYYEQAVKWAVDNNITTGITSDRFAPNDSCTRAQIVTFLYRNSMNESEPEA